MIITNNHNYVFSNISNHLGSENFLAALKYFFWLRILGQSGRQPLTREIDSCPCVSDDKDTWTIATQVKIDGSVTGPYGPVNLYLCTGYK